MIQPLRTIHRRIFTTARRTLAGDPGRWIECQASRRIREHRRISDPSELFASEQSVGCVGEEFRQDRTLFRPS